MQMATSTYLMNSFIRGAYPDGQCLMQDNDLKHTSRKAWKFHDDEGFNWWSTSAESPDCNPIENMAWVKGVLRTEIKARIKEDLVRGIETFWDDHVVIKKCRRYILNLCQVLPKVIELEEGPTGY